MLHIVTAAGFLIPGIVHAKVTRLDYLVKEKVAVVRSRGNRHVLCIKAKHLLHDVHECTHETQHADTLE